MVDRLDDNYYHRKCYLEREQVPTQSIIIKKMKPPLAQVYFKSLSYPRKVLAGLEPPLKGGGKVWYQPPEDLLKGRAVLKPVAGKHLKLLGNAIIEEHSVRLFENQQKRLHNIKKQALLNSDNMWKKRVLAAVRNQEAEQSKIEARNNITEIRHAFSQFMELYQTSLTELEDNLMQVSIQQIEELKELKYQEIKKGYEIRLKEQSTNLYAKYEKLLMDEKARLKDIFIKNVQTIRHEMVQKIHDINVDKHVTLEKLRHLLECRNIACQVYVALKERDECKKEMQISVKEHTKTVKDLKETINMQDFEIKQEIEKARKRTEFKSVWKTKIACIVKKFQEFVTYCLRTLPEIADFFINMERLMMLQLDVALDNPSVESIFIRSEDYLEPVAKPHPFRLFCDKGFRPQVDQTLCPKHCTSSATLLPAIVVNRKCLYAACDNYAEFYDKINKYILEHKRGDDTDFEDDHYSYDIPVLYTSSQHKQEIKLQSSLMVVLQKEFVNLKEVDTECRLCKIPYCFTVDKKTSMPKVSSTSVTESSSISYGNRINRSQELLFEREPKWGSYFEYVLPKKCVCSKIAKIHLQEHMPAYMKKTSKFEEPELLNYERCSVETLKSLVRHVKEKGKKTTRPLTPVGSTPKASAGTQYKDPDYEVVCKCLSDDELDKFWNYLNKTVIKKEERMTLLGDDLTISPAFLTRSKASFATERAHSLRRLLCTAPDLKEAFESKNTNKI